MTFFDRLAIGAAALTICGLWAIDPAFAAGGGVDQVLTSIIAMLNGTIARSVAVLAVMAIGFAWMFGQIDMRTAGFCVMGMGLVFGASTIVSTIAGV
jgi:type IV secretion system protein VirB2